MNGQEERSHEVAGGMRHVERRSRSDSGIVSLSNSELYDPDTGTWSFAPRGGFRLLAAHA